MKRLNEVLGTLFAICMMLNSCAKNEESISKMEATDTMVYTNPSQPGSKPGVEPPDPIPLPATHPDVGGPVDTLYDVIQNPTAAYIKETCLFDISKMEAGSYYHQVNNKDINIGFFGIENVRIGDAIRSGAIRFTNIPGSSFGWHELWNYPPYVERERPEVLFSSASYGGGFLVLAFSKPCIEFGFELSPNLQGLEHLYDVYFGNFVFDGSAGHAAQMIKTPSGARLFAVKSTKPFSVVTIAYDLSSYLDYPLVPLGLALANIRYKLAP